MTERPSESEGSDEGSERREYGQRASYPSDFRAPESALEFFDPGLVLGFFRRLENILEACPVDIYAASSLKHPWPYRLQNAAECYPASFWRSNERLLDSAITSPELTNEDILEHACERHATAVIAKDYLPFKVYDGLSLEEDQRATVDALQEQYTDNLEELPGRQVLQSHPTDVAVLGIVPSPVAVLAVLDGAERPIVLLGDVQLGLGQLDLATLRVDGQPIVVADTLDAREVLEYAKAAGQPRLGGSHRAVLESGEATSRRIWWAFHRAIS